MAAIPNIKRLERWLTEDDKPGVSSTRGSLNTSMNFI